MQASQIWQVCGARLRLSRRSLKADKALELVTAVFITSVSTCRLADTIRRSSTEGLELANDGRSTRRTCAQVCSAHNCSRRLQVATPPSMNALYGGLGFLKCYMRVDSGGLMLGSFKTLSGVQVN